VGEIAEERKSSPFPSSPACRTSLLRGNVEHKKKGFISCDDKVNWLPQRNSKAVRSFPALALSQSESKGLSD